jgi:aminopeptidase N
MAMQRQLFQVLTFSFLIAFLLVGCGVGKTNVKTKQTTGIVEISGDEEEAPLAPYKASRTVLTDLVHTKLEISFDWQKAWLYGKATITAKQHFFTSDSLFLDAQGMEIKSIQLKDKNLNYSYSNDILRIQLDRAYTRDENYTIFIEYIAKPNDRKDEGGKAITSSKGLFFINPTGEKKDVMPQIWTQGETESNSVWFPTIDSPNAKSSQEMLITVADKYVTLSNGKLISSTKHADGTRTDHWKQELPHAPYLFMMAVGEFKVVKDHYTRPDGSKMDVFYYVEPEWENSARKLFGETPNMISYFSKLTGVEFPWDKYHQVVVRDYVSGAMENTGAVIFGDFVYRTDRELLDKNSQAVVAHELFHHWFGDLVTCESWANLPLNESFANYSQYLWDEYRHGLDEADYGNEEETDEYFAEFEGGVNHDVIWYNHAKNVEMFDKHSYNKGGRILHMLRNYLGDEAFFAGLRNYLQTNKFKAAEIDHLRLAFEEVSGQDLHWFFNQWFLNAGFPDLYVEQYVSNANKEIVVSVTQKQDFSTTPLYRLPVKIAVWDDAGEHIYKVEINEKEEKFLFPANGKVKLVLFDYDQVLLAKVTESKPTEQYIEQYYVGKKYLARKAALINGANSDYPKSQQLILDALADPFWKIREIAIEKAAFLTGENKQKGIEIIKGILRKDTKSSVRTQAVVYLSEVLSPMETTILLRDHLLEELSYKVISTSIVALNKVNHEAALEILKSYEADKTTKMRMLLANVYCVDGNPQHINFFFDLVNNYKFKGYDMLTVLNTFSIYMSKQNIEVQMKALDVYKTQWATGNNYVKMGIPNHVNYMIQTVESQMGNSPSNSKDIELQKAFVKELKNYLESIEPNK